MCWKNCVQNGVVIKALLQACIFCYPFFFFLVMLDGSDVLEPAVVFTATKLFLNGIFQLFLCQMDYKNSISTLQVKAKFFWVILQAWITLVHCYVHVTSSIKHHHLIFCLCVFTKQMGSAELQGEIRNGKNFCNISAASTGGPWL